MEFKVFTKVIDSNERQLFSTGSQRDSDVGKGMPSLIPAEFLLSLFSRKKFQVELQCAHPNFAVEKLISSLFKFGSTKEDDYNSEIFLEEINSVIDDSIELILSDQIGEEKGLFPFKTSLTIALRRLAIHYQNGAKKYDPNNWRKGQPISRYYDSTCRHLWSYLELDKSEDHLAAILWNSVAIHQTFIDVQKGKLPSKLNDFPYSYSNFVDHE